MKLCRECGTEKRQQRIINDRAKQTEVRKKKLSIMKRIPEKVYGGKKRCLRCGHAFKIGTSADVACGYIDDAEIFGLPKRPWPRPDVSHCLYWSPAPNGAGWLTEKEKREIYNPELKPILDMDKLKIYTSAGTASATTGIPFLKITEECKSTEDINAPRRWRYLHEDELPLIIPRKE